MAQPALRRLVRSALPLLVLVLVLAATGCRTSPATEDEHRLERALAALTADAHEWASQLRGTAVVQGTLRVPDPVLATLASGNDPDGKDMAGNEVWYPRLRLDGARCIAGEGAAEPALTLCVHDQDRAQTLRTLRDGAGQEVWLLVQPVMPSADDLHVLPRTEPQLRAVCELLRASPGALAGEFAHPVAAVDAVFADLRAQRIDAQQAMDRLGARDASLLPGLLLVMLDAIERPRPADVLAGDGDVMVDGYHTGCGSTFDVACFASQRLRGFLAGPPDDEAGRLAELRSLAVWLRLVRVVPPAHAKSASAR